MERSTPGGELQDGLKRLLDAKDFCDATIVCGPKRIAVHKNVLSARSEFFHKAFTVNMKEKCENTIELHEDIEVVESLIRFCYTGDYDTPKFYATKAFVEHHAMVYVTARKYLLDALCKLAKHKWMTKAAQQISEVALNGDLKGYVDVLQYIYENTTHRNDILRQAAATLTRRRGLLNVYGGEEDVWHEFIVKVPDFGLDFMLTASRRLGRLEGYVSASKFQRCECDHIARVDIGGGNGTCHLCEKEYVTDEDELMEKGEDDDNEPW